MFDAILNQVKNAIYNDPTTPQQPGNDPSGLIKNIEDIFANMGGLGAVGGVLGGLTGMNPAAAPQGGQANVRPASEDPLGDPANMGSASGARPASEDPLGDPADGALKSQFHNLKSAREDPLGDPADQGR